MSGNFDRAVALTVAILLALPCLPSAARAQTAIPERCATSATSKLTVNVKDKGAKGDGRTNDAAAIQRAVDAVAGTGGTVFIPDGTYLVDVIGPNRIMLKSRMTLRLAPGAVLKAIPNGAKSYAVVTINGVSDVTVTGGTLEGERDQHSGTEGEYGHGIRMERGAKNVSVSDIRIRNMWGDGIFIEATNSVAICGLTAERNRRQGISVIEAEGILVTNSVFKNTHGTRPSAGIDLEPDRSEQRITNVRITRSRFLDNAGAGVLVSGRKGANNVTNVEISSNFFRGTPPVKIEYAPGVLDSAICKNRYVVRQEQPHDLAMVADRPEEIIVTAACGDPGLRKRQ